MENANTNKNEGEILKNLAELLVKETKEKQLSERNAKLRMVLLLLAQGTMLATALALPGAVRLLGDFLPDDSDWKEWKMFNKKYLRQTIRKLEKKKIIEVVDGGTFGEIRLKEDGRKKVLKMGLESLKINKPDKWDRKWRMVFYDVFDSKKGTRERLRNYLKGAGFYPLQKSVYLHAYPCEKEIEFLKYFLGLSGAVRIVLAEKIENDQEFRDYFGVS
ncbi:hypothetical protein HY085_00990 [Candidatus Gottesmanbacteria bacterium]|nr:hypothetical protein [Candidatus Gottesmanbacteria bacterium]